MTEKEEKEIMDWFDQQPDPMDVWDECSACEGLPTPEEAREIAADEGMEVSEIDTCPYPGFFTKCPRRGGEDEIDYEEEYDMEAATDSELKTREGPRPISFGEYIL